MRKFVIVGIASVIIAFAAAEGGAMGGGDIAPGASPYALLNEPSVASPSNEGRSADVSEFYQPSIRQVSDKRHRSQHWRRSLPLQ
jgi:hypothetical protein